MITEYLSYHVQEQVVDVLDDLRQHGEQYSDYDIQYAYVVTDTGKLVGVLRLRDLRDFFRQYTFLGMPVVDDAGLLVGVIRSSSVRDAANKRNNQLFLKFAGIVGGEEFRSMPLVKRSSRRLSWLSINIVLNIIAASVIALYQDTL
jgi:magnesium transporter